MINIGAVNEQVVDRFYDEDGFECVRRSEIWVVVAEHQDGRRWVLRDGTQAGTITVWDNEADAVEDARVAVSPLMAPGLWNEMDPAYGSSAWGPDAEAALACFEADCYDEPRPDWAAY